MGFKLDPREIGWAPYAMIGGGLVLGTWQGVYLYEHRTAPHDRRLVVTVSGARAR